MQQNFLIRVVSPFCGKWKILTHFQMYKFNRNFIILVIWYNLYLTSFFLFNLTIRNPIWQFKYSLWHFNKQTRTLQETGNKGSIKKLAYCWFERINLSVYFKACYFSEFLFWKFHNIMLFRSIHFFLKNWLDFRLETTLKRKGSYA